MTLPIEKCLPAKVINTMNNSLFSLAKCLCAKSITAQYNLIVGRKDSTCETNRRNIPLLLSIEIYAFAKSSHAHFFDWDQWIVSSCDTAVHNAQHMWLAPRWLAKVLEAQHEELLQWKRLPVRNSPTYNTLNCFHIQILRFPNWSMWYTIQCFKKK